MFEALRSSIVLVLMVATFMASLKPTLTVAPSATCVAPEAGVRELTVGGVVSAAGV